mmetsp:Transcript_32819/g.78396  ORF Transcript_32819/g.78396 Transcript_32819/m.78396 type:complete len:215 (-) Transcript_32819:2209-2853(-)
MGLARIPLEEQGHVVSVGNSLGVFNMREQFLELPRSDLQLFLRIHAVLLIFPAQLLDHVVPLPLGLLVPTLHAARVTGDVAHSHAAQGPLVLTRMLVERRLAHDGVGRARSAEVFDALLLEPLLRLLVTPLREYPPLEDASVANRLKYGLALVDAPRSMALVVPPALGVSPCAADGAAHHGLEWECLGGLAAKLWLEPAALFLFEVLFVENTMR